MLFFGIKNLWFKLGVFSMLAAWSGLFVVLIYRNFFITDPFNPNLQGTERYGHNSAGDFQQYAVMIFIEFLILAAVLLPFSFSRFYWVRLLILQPLLAGWFLLMAVAGMHGGGVHALHTLYLLGVNALIFILLVAAIVAEIVNNRKINKFKTSDGTNSA